MPGMRLLIDGAMQQAAQASRQFMAGRAQGRSQKARREDSLAASAGTLAARPFSHDFRVPPAYNLALLKN